MSGTGVLQWSSARRRLMSVVVPVAAGALVLGACGGSDDGAGSPTATTLSLNTTAFATIPPATTTTVVENPIAEDGTSSVEQTYEIQFGDFPLGVADRFGITVEELAAYNEIPDCSSTSCGTFPGPGTVIRIPPGAEIPADTGGGTDDGTITVTGGQDDTGDAGDDGDGGDGEEPAGDTLPEAGDNCGAGSYVIEEGDFPLAVAEKFDVTVDALNAANAGNGGYTSFIVGTSIVIPARDDC